MTSKSKRYCSVPQCNNYVSANVSMHKFPTDITLRKKWKLAMKIGKPLSPYMCVCSEHFLSQDFTKGTENSRKKYLKKGSIPSQKVPVCSHAKLLQERKKPTRKPLLEDEMEVVAEHLINDHLPYSTTVPNNLILDQNKHIKHHGHMANTLYGAQKDPLENIIFEDTEHVTKQFEDKAVQTDLEDFQLTSILDTDTKLGSFAGINNQLLKTIAQRCYKISDYNNVDAYLKMKLLIVFIKLRLNIPFVCLAILFSISATECLKIFYNTLGIVTSAMKPVIYWPMREEVRANLPKCFAKFKTTRVVLDRTEISVQKCSCLNCCINSYANYKKTHTIKWLIGTTPLGVISYVSSGYNGHASDKSIVIDENLLIKCDPGDSVMVDKGVLIKNKCEELFLNLIQPPILRNGRQLSKQDAEIAANIARARVHVERTIQRLKTFKILCDTVEWYLIPYIDSIMYTIAAVVNLSAPILSDDKFDDTCLEENYKRIIK